MLNPTEKLKVKRIHPSAKLPERKTSGSVGYDVYCLSSFELEKDEVTVVSTGISVEAPTWYHVELYLRSSMGMKGVTLVNSVGIIDKDYRGEIKLMLTKLTPGVLYVAGETRVGQLVVRKTRLPDIEEVNDLNDTERGTGGFGSTGAN